MEISSKLFGRTKLRARIAKRFYNLDNLLLGFRVIDVLKVPGKQVINTLGRRNCNMKSVFFAARWNRTFAYQALG